jgi:hypothetical protein
VNRLETLRQGKKTAEELNMEFLQIIGQAEMDRKASSDHLLLIGYYRKVLKPRVSHSVVAAPSWCFAILVNKFCKIMKIFEQLGHLRDQWVLCQHLEIRAAVPEIFNQLSNQLCKLPVTNNYFSSFLLLLTCGCLMLFILLILT